MFVVDAAVSLEFVDVIVVVVVVVAAAGTVVCKCFP